MRSWAFWFLLGTHLLWAQGTSLEDKASQKDQAEILQEADSVFDDVSRLSGLSILHPVQKVFKGRAFFRDYMTRQMRTLYPPEKEKGFEKAYTLLGLLSPGTDLIQTYLSSFLQEIQGVYDPQTKTLYIADWVSSGDQEATLAHELTHALQDQHFDLTTYVARGADQTTDEQYARMSVMEGQAVAIALNLRLEEKGTDFTQVVNIAHWVEMNLMLRNEGERAFGRRALFNNVTQFPYVYGATFLQSYVRAYGWGAMKGLFEHPPTSTHQILHPEDFFPKRRSHLKISIDDLSRGPLRGYSKIWENTMGEFGLTTLLKGYDLDGDGVKALGGWRGDQFQVYERKEDLVLVGFLHFKDEAQAGDFLGAYKELMDKKFNVDLIRRDDEDIHWISLQGGDHEALVERSGPRIVIVEGARTEEVVPVRDELWGIHSDKNGLEGGEKPGPPVLDTP